MAQQRISQQVGAELKAGASHGTVFFGSIGSGVLIGWLLDRWLGTDPWLLVGFALLGVYSGFLRSWQVARQEEERYAEERRVRGR